MRVRAQRRGAAAVEMAITMVVLIPLIFFALFLQDFVAYRLEGQEPLVGAAWDHITPDYMKKKPDVGGMNRLKYCDHTAAYDSYNRDFDCQGAPGGADEGDTGDGQTATTGGTVGLGHHHATGAHQCWLGGGKQIRCAVGKAGVQMLAGTAMTAYYAADDWNRGGLSTCTAQLNVFNFIIPRQRDGWLWSKKAATNRKQFGKSGGGERMAGDKKWDDNYSIGDSHKDGASTNATDAQGDGENEMGSWLMSTESMALLVDPWALTHIKKVMPLEGLGMTMTTYPGMVPGVDKYNPLLDRTGHYFMSYADGALTKANDWHNQMDDYLSPDSQVDGKGDHLHSVPVTWSEDINRPGYKCCNGSGKTKPARPGEFPRGWGPQ